MGTAAKVLVGASVIIGGFLLVVGTLTSRSSEVMLVELALGSLIRYLGAALAVVSGAAILVKAVSGASPINLVGLSVPLVAGLLIADYHWALAVYLWVLGMGYFAERIIGRPRDAPPKEAAVPPAPDQD